MTAPAQLTCVARGDAVTLATVSPQGRRAHVTLLFGRDEEIAYDALGAMIILAEIGKGTELEPVERAALHRIVARLRERAARD